MLLNFEVENYKSFQKNAVFTMEPAPKQHGLDYSILTEKIKRKKVNALCSSVIYGPNASGKTNIIGAMDTLRAIVLRGKIINAESQETPNKAASNLELIPNNLCKEVHPVVFKIEFVENNMKFNYELSVMLGLFLDDSYSRSVKHECLKINDELVFCRDKEVELGDFKQIKEYVTSQITSDRSTVKELINQSLATDELFITNGFKLMISQSIAKIITDWFTEKFMVIYRADPMHISRFSDPKKKTMYVEKTISDAAKIFGINSNTLAYIPTGKDGEVRLCSIIRDLKKTDQKNTDQKEDESKNQLIAVLADVFESFGTIRFINLFPLVIRAITTGGTLVVDEFDASIHPMALMSIINIFHNDDINKKRAQVIFNTHNPIFLNSNIFRRDEIKFVEKDDETLLSKIYALSSFGTAGPNGVRKGDDYMKNYFLSQYGAIKTIDFSPIFETIMNKANDND